MSGTPKKFYGGIDAVTSPIINIADPSNSQDAGTKNYIDNGLAATLTSAATAATTYTDGAISTEVTNRNTAIAAAVSAGSVAKYTTSFTGDSSTTSFSISHGLGVATAVLVQVYANSDGSLLDCVPVLVDSNNLNITFVIPPPNGTYRVIVVG